MSNGRKAGMRGAALLLVMWLIVLLTALVGAFAMTAKIEHLQGRVLHRGLVAQQAARAGIEYAIHRVEASDPPRRWLPDGRDYPWRFDDAELTIRITDESGKVDLNQADATLLAMLFTVLGSEQADAARVAAAILDWRDPDPLTQPSGGAEDPDYASAGRAHGAKDALFESVAEVEQVLGMTPALYAKVEPYLTVLSGRSTPDPTFAAAEVLRAMGQDPEPILAGRRASNPANGGPAGGQVFMGNNSGTYSIESRARLRDRREAVLRVVVRAGGNGIPGSAYTPLRWEEGASPR
jgi:general secretion pathway protein K